MAWEETARTSIRSTLSPSLLDAAAVPEPYLLVGFSFGGLLAIMYAATYPDQMIPEDEREPVMADLSP